MASLEERKAVPASCADGRGGTLHAAAVTEVIDFLFCLIFTQCMFTFHLD
jgi:hypothetical protein